jgi:hypothetical protein
MSKQTNFELKIAPCEAVGFEGKTGLFLSLLSHKFGRGEADCLIFRHDEIDTERRPILADFEPGLIDRFLQEALDFAWKQGLRPSAPSKRVVTDNRMDPPLVVYLDDEPELLTETAKPALPSTVINIQHLTINAAGAL